MSAAIAKGSTRKSRPVVVPRRPATLAGLVALCPCHFFTDLSYGNGSRFPATARSVCSDGRARRNRCSEHDPAVRCDCPQPTVYKLFHPSFGRPCVRRRSSDRSGETERRAIHSRCSDEICSCTSATKPRTRSWSPLPRHRALRPMDGRTSRSSCWRCRDSARHCAHPATSTLAR
jgi:hypothetical protein